jgi:hypothetical protein
MLLSASVIIGKDPQDGARWLGALLFAANVFLVGFGVLRYTKAAWAAALAAVFVAGIEAVLQAHYYAWSEPPFVFLSLIGLLALGGYVQQPRMRPLIIAGVAAGLSLITRQAGMALLVTGAVVIVLLVKIPLKRKLRDACIFAIPACLPMALWTLRNQLLSGTAVDRGLNWHPPSATIITGGLINVSRWFLPGVPSNPDALKSPANWFTSAWTAPSDAATWTGLILGFVLVLLIVALFIFRKRTADVSEPPPEQVPAPSRLFETNLLIFGIFVALYIGLITAVSTIFNPPISYEKRLLVPFLIPATVLTFSAAYVGTMRRRIFRIVLLIACLLIVYMHIATSVWWVQGRHVKGLGYEGPLWQQEMKVIQYIQGLPKGQVVYANEETAVMAVTRRDAARIPAKRSILRGEDRKVFVEQVNKMAQTLRDRGGVIVFFYREAAPDPNLPTPEDLMKTIPLKRVFDTKRGVAYVLDEPAPPANKTPAP